MEPAAVACSSLLPGLVDTAMPEMAVEAVMEVASTTARPSLKTTSGLYLPLGRLVVVPDTELGSVRFRFCTSSLCRGK